MILILLLICWNGLIWIDQKSGVGQVFAGNEVDTLDAHLEQEHGVRYPNRCETCKILAIELQDRLRETGKSHEVIETGYSLDDVKGKKRTSYQRSELRLLESLERVCERILSYNLHKERSDSTRFAKGMSQTFKTLHGLVDKGVKVNLGIPYELWDKPPVEVTQLKTQCEDMIEEYEDIISEWYFLRANEDNDTTIDLLTYLCEQNVLRNDEERKCLTEESTKTKEAPKSRLKNDQKKSEKSGSEARKHEL